MTKIKLYPIDDVVNGTDKWIGTDSVSPIKATKNFTPNKLADFFTSSESITVSNSITFVYDTVDLGDDRKSGSFSFETEQGAIVLFSDISELIFSKNSLSGKLTVNFMESIIGSYILLQQSRQPNNFGFYKMTGYTQRLDDINFYDVTLDLLTSNGSIEEDFDYTFSLVQFESLVEGDKNYVHSQDVASDTWTIQHNLNKYASATMVLSTGQKGYGDVQYIDENNLTITFAGDETGKAYIN